ncbi:GNAT family N-acetyltransferase [Mangrovimonas sp. YM274]|uniref:GNAT family N-acetyltransferase n=1 Tax=Mangrovimonas sp. YM274 TaxID=3070660 RepID=UPI0027DBD365|nr:GNAT family N-acetyltransferase [Mangrovimonas sp. YM274]WMI67209.1 GNAT family N-acetyltransferase [Mangrovimonas sp. YM274]
MITVKEIHSKKELKAFVKFPFKLYKDNKYWVPPMINDEVESFDPELNPVFKHAQASYFLAYRDNEIVGRIAAIINWTEVKTQDKKVRFGWFDVIDDVEVTKALLDKVIAYGKAHNLEFIEGPMGFSNLDKVGVLTEGYDQLSTMITWYNHPYYVTHLEKLGYIKQKEYIEGHFDVDKVKPEQFERMVPLISRRYGVRALNFSNTKDLLPYVDRMFDLFNQTYANLASFVAISEEQKAYFKKKYIPLINPNYIKFILDRDDNIIAFSIVLPSFSKAIQKAKGKMFPFGFYHLLKAKKHCEEAVFYLIGVHPEYQNKGVTALIFKEFYDSFRKDGVKRCIRTPELEENMAIHQLWKNFDSPVTKRRRTYRKDI